MSSITIRNIDERLKARLRMRAVEHGQSVEDEARDILQASLSTKKSTALDLAASIRAKFSAIGGITLPETPREATRPPVTFES